MNNPFTPTFGIVPPFLAGRDEILRDMGRAFDNWPGDPNLSSVLIGPRGSGKTAMLSCIGDEARKSGWIVADTIAMEGMQEDILQKALSETADLLGKREKRALTGINIGQFIGLTWSVGETERLNWRMRMSELLRELRKREIGLLITIDEVRPDEPEMIRTASIYQLLVREGARVALAMAGLPVHVSSLINDKSVSFLRRSRQRFLGRISDRDVRSAFRLTVEEQGKTISPVALEKAVKATDGFAYMMQLVGYFVWDVSGTHEEITEEHAEIGIRNAYDDFRDGVLDSTYNELSKGDKYFLASMLEDPAGSTVSGLAERMGKSPGYISTYKKRLLQAGVIEELSGKRLDFAIPGLRAYVEEQGR